MYYNITNSFDELTQDWASSLISNLTEKIIDGVIEGIKAKCNLEEIRKVKSEDEEHEVFDMLRIADVCDILNVTPMTLGRWDKCGYLKKRKAGHKVYYYKSDIENLIERRNGV